MPSGSRVIARARTVGPWRALCIGVLLAYLVGGSLQANHAGYSLPVNGVLYSGVYFACAACCAMRAPLARRSALIW